MRRLFTVLALLWLAPASAQSELPGLSPSEAHALHQAGEIVLIDIRQPEEWRQTGVAEGAIQVSMNHPDGGEGFVRDVLQAVDNDTDAPVVVICRTGNRTSQLVPALRQLGFSRVYHVPQGMVGNASGSGWIDTDLPVEDCTAC